MKTTFKIIAFCVGMALLVYLEPIFISFWICTMGGSLTLKFDPSNFLIVLCFMLFAGSFAVWFFYIIKGFKKKWKPWIISLPLIICQLLVTSYLKQRYVSPMKANQYGRLKTEGHGWNFGLADKWGNDIIPPYYRSVKDYGEYAKLFRSNGDSIKYDFLEKRFIEYEPIENYHDDNINSVNTHISDNSNNNSSEASKTQTVHVVRDPIPVQEWETCMACMGAGKITCDLCGGSGTKYFGDNLKVCNYCNGKGERTCYPCSGRGGHYYTVYK